MKLSWSMISILSRFGATAIGLVQSFIVVKLLTPSEYGLMGIAMGIGASIGVYQNLGISSGSTREIAAAQSKSEAFKVFIGSLLVRYLIAIPLVVLLMFFSGWISESVNNRPELVMPLRLFALTLFVQALQSTLNSVIQGFKKFKFLFNFQILIAFVSLLIYIPFVSQYGLVGYFYALLTFNLISTGVLLFYSLKQFEGNFEFPGFKELVEIIKSIFAIGLFVYLIKIIDTQWQRFGPVLLAVQLDNIQIGILTFALMISSKIVMVSDAITDVTLPSMTDVYKKNKDQFLSILKKGNTSATILITLVCLIVIFFKYEIFMIIDYLFLFVGKGQILATYADSFKLMDPLVIAFWGYSHINLLRSGFSVPSKNLKGAVFSHLVLFLATFLMYTLSVGFIGDLLYRFSISMAVGGLAAYISFVIFVFLESKIKLIQLVDLVVVMLAFISLILFYVGTPNIIVFVLFLMPIYFIYKKNK
jgi:O-antigen/teichoic acid export membrane protein